MPVGCPWLVFSDYVGFLNQGLSHANSLFNFFFLHRQGIWIMDTCMYAGALPILKAEQHMVGYVSRLPFGSSVFGANQDLPPQMLKKQTYTNLCPPSIESKY